MVGVVKPITRDMLVARSAGPEAASKVRGEAVGPVSHPSLSPASFQVVRLLRWIFQQLLAVDRDAGSQARRRVDQHPRADHGDEGQSRGAGHHAERGRHRPGCRRAARHSLSRRLLVAKEFAGQQDTASRHRFAVALLNVLPRPHATSDFEGLCAVFSGSGVLDGAQTSYSTLIFCAAPSIASISPTSLWGLGVSGGISLATVLGGVGADAVLFQMKLGCPGTGLPGSRGHWSRPWPLPWPCSNRPAVEWSRLLRRDGRSSLRRG